MATVRPWIAKLIGKALAEVLDDESDRGTPSPSLFNIKQGESNLTISPDVSLLGEVQLVQIRSRPREVAVLLGDTEHTIHATITQEALREPAITTDGTSFEELQIGAIFKIVGCRIRVSDCFDPPRIEIQVLSFAVVSHTSAHIAQLKRVEEESFVLAQLCEYSKRRSSEMDSDSENVAPFASQEDFSTQIPYRSPTALAPSRTNMQRHSGNGLKLNASKSSERSLYAPSKPSNNMAAYASARDMNGAHSSSRTTASAREAHLECASSQFITQMPVQTEKRRKLVQQSDEHKTRLRDVQREQQKSPREEPNVNSKCNARATSQEAKSPPRSGRSLWRQRTVAGQYVPRYLRFKPKKIDQEQQTLLDDLSAGWQPALIGQPAIEGQVPIKLLERLTRAADERAEAACQSPEEADASEQDAVEIPKRELRPTIEPVPQAKPSASQHSPSLVSSQVTWSDSEHGSPQRQEASRLRLPPDTPSKSARNSADVELIFQRPNTGSRSSLAPTHQDIEVLSSHISPAPDSDNEDSLRPSSAGEETSALPEIATSAAKFDSTDESRMESEARHPPGTHTGQNSSSNSAVAAAATSSLDSPRNVQVRRTPMIHRRKSDPVRTATENRLGNGTMDTGYPSLPQPNLAQSLPPSSIVVHGTYFPKPQARPVPAPTTVSLLDMPRPRSSLSHEDHKPSVEQIPKEVERSDSGQVGQKRQRESSMSASSSKRSRLEEPQRRPQRTLRVDPDLMEWESKHRQVRRNEIMKTREEDRVTEERASYTPVPAKDNKSIESRDRSVSLQSSVVSVARNHVSTPITRSSDYQLPQVDKEHEARLLGHISHSNQAQDTFDRFKLEYPGYLGARHNFDKACQLIRQLRCPASDWDDFVYRYVNDYVLDYKEGEVKDGEQHLPYEQWYHERVDEPERMSRIIEREYIQGISSRCSLSESTPGVSGQSFMAPQLRKRESLVISSTTEDAGPAEPQLPPLPPQSRAEAGPRVESPRRKSQQQTINHSQESSVKMWLERATGEESPELGTPPLAKQVADVPMLDLDAPASTPAYATERKSTRRTVPWLASQDPPSTAQPASRLASAQKIKDEKGKGKAPRRHTDFPVRRQDEMIDLTRPVIFHKPRPNALPPLEKLGIEFASNDEIRGLPKPPARSVVDIFAWRK